MNKRSLRRACVVALGPALVLGATAPSALAGPTAPAPAAAAVTTDPVQPGAWGAATQAVPAGENTSFAMASAADGTVAALRDRATNPSTTAEIRTLTVMVRPAGGTTWGASVVLTTKADWWHNRLTAQGDGSFVASWLERGEGSEAVLKAATLAPGATTWSAPTTVTTLGWWPDAVQVFGSATGRLTAAWAEKATGGMQVRLTERAAPGEAWSQPALVDTVKGTGEEGDGGEWYLTGLSGAVDKNGNAVLVWNMDDAQRDVAPAKDGSPAPAAAAAAIDYHSRIMERPAGAAAWGEAKDLAVVDGTGPAGMRVDAHPAGGFTLVWGHFSYAQDDRAVRFARQSVAGGAWSAAELTPFTGNDAPRSDLPRPLVGPKGEVTLVTAPYGARKVLSATRDAATGAWSAPAQLDDRYPEFQGKVSTGIGTDGTAYAGWTVRLGEGSYAYVTSFRTPTGWSAPKALATTPRTGVADPVFGVLAVSGTRPTVLWSTYHKPLYAVSGVARPVPRYRDLSDDARADVLSLTGTTLTRYLGDGAGHLARGTTHTASVTTGWTAGTRFAAFGDLNGDRVNDVLAVLPTGEARMYQTPAGRLPAPASPYKKVSADWRGYDVLTSPGDLTGDGRADLLVREKAGGTLWLYPGSGTFGFASRVKIGPGWNAYTRVIGAGDLDGDGRGDVLALDGSGELWRYNGTGKGTLTARALVFRDWGKTYKQLLGAGDLNGDGRADLLSVDSSGVARFNPGNGRGGFGDRVRISSGWTGRTVS
ncbi:FG-GAP repeat domain-containing protein [Streptomyces sp. NPDC093225]|uniref:FG-GAP repeat domain-containing protein n=1 Tax=Streptomyces sp. NPDC093225 TaxID=3366034 RepID=UPI0037FB24B9